MNNTGRHMYRKARGKEQIAMCRIATLSYLSYCIGQLNADVAPKMMLAAVAGDDNADAELVTAATMLMELFGLMAEIMAHFKDNEFPGFCFVESNKTKGEGDGDGDGDMPDAFKDFLNKMK
ncbi:MAG: hypothetical protein RMN25_14240 [Anaerolineae bacterium]|nr:hypothetical protein [Thermoflexales bacterium]MDW8408929.1 hypothetical protein [Anaerolineae bacterium]